MEKMLRKGWFTCYSCPDDDVFFDDSDDKVVYECKDSLTLTASWTPLTTDPTLCRSREDLPSSVREESDHFINSARL